jgi:hypothetical protein
LIASILWLPLSLLMHTAAHEGSHALAATALGQEVTSIYLLPSSRLGYWTWASMTYRGAPLTKRQRALIAAAPLVADAALATIALAILQSDAPRWMRAAALTDLGCSAVDASVVLAGAATGRGDGAQILATVRW